MNYKLKVLESCNIFGYEYCNGIDFELYRCNFDEDIIYYNREANLIAPFPKERLQKNHNTST